MLSSFITSILLSIGGLVARPQEKPTIMSPESTQKLSSRNISPLEKGNNLRAVNEVEKLQNTIPQCNELNDQKYYKNGVGNGNRGQQDLSPTQIYDQNVHDANYSWWKRIPPKSRGILAALLLIIILINENFFIWFVSSAYTPSHSPPFPEALQDNGRDLLLFLKTKCNFTMADIQWARDTLNVQWSLVSSSCIVLLLLDLGWAVFEGHDKTIWSVGARTVLTVALARLIRTLAFTLTVLPSQMANCYLRRFPYPVPEFGSWEWFKEGWVPRSKGGCNDLIISGHAVITSGFGCLITDALSPAKHGRIGRTVRIIQGKEKKQGLLFGNGCASSWAIWMLVTVDYSIEVFQGFHYSIDMLLGMIITRLVFSVLSDFGRCDEDEVDEIMRVKRRPASFASLDLKTKESDDGDGHGKATVSFPSRKSSILSGISTFDLSRYSLPPFVAFVWMNYTAINANYAIFLYSLLAALFYSKKDEEYAKFHIFCVLYIALSLYL